MHKTINFISIVASILVLSAVILNSVSIKTIYTQALTSVNNTRNLFSNQSTSSISTALNGPYQGSSIKLFLLNTLIRSEQWDPINNFTSHGWDIKVMLPLDNERKFLVVLQKENAMNSTFR